MFLNALSLGNGAPADGVVGQSDLTTCTAPGGPSPTTLHFPEGLKFDNSSPEFFGLFVSDWVGGIESGIQGIPDRRRGAEAREHCRAVLMRRD